MMLQLPDTDRANNCRREGVRGKSAGPKFAEDRLSTTRAAEHRLQELEGPIANARLMASILATIVCKFQREVGAYVGLPPAITASKMAGDVADEMEQILFAAYHLEEMLRDLDNKYMADVAVGAS